MILELDSQFLILNSAVLNSFSSNFRCDYCAEIFLSYQTLHRHCAYLHAFPCKTCKVAFSDQNGLDIHNKTVHKDSLIHLQPPTSSPQPEPQTVAPKSVMSATKVHISLAQPVTSLAQPQVSLAKPQISLVKPQVSLVKPQVSLVKPQVSLIKFQVSLITF